MKTAIIFCSLVLLCSTSHSAFAHEQQNLVLGSPQVQLLSQEFSITAGPLHKGGDFSYTITGQDVAHQSVGISMHYSIRKRALVPVSDEFLSGDLNQSLPMNCLSEAGYLELEKIHQMDFDDTTVTHLGRVNMDGLTDVHHIKISANNGKFDFEAYYHPSLPGLGWSRVVIILHTPIPLLANYKIMAVKN